MKKLLGTLCICAMLVTLAGCKDGVAGISDSNDALVTVNDTKITKGDIYSQLKKSAGSASTISLIKDKIFEKEGIKLNDKIKKDAEDSVNKIKKSYKTEKEFTDALISYGYKDVEDFKEKSVYATSKEKELLNKYVTEKKSSMFETYHPVKAQIMEIAKKDDAKKALDALKAKDDFEKVTKKYGTTTTYKGKEAIYSTESGLPSAVSSKVTSASKKGLITEVIEDTESKKFYLVNVTNIDPTSFEKEALDAIATSGSSTLTQNCMAYYMKKYKFTIYDIDLYNAIKTSNEAYITQD